MSQDKVIFDKVYKQLRLVPPYVKDKVFTWALDVELKGLREIRKIPGYHDEPLKGERAGQRSIRLTRSYRLIYFEEAEGFINLVNIIEVNKHEY